MASSKNNFAALDDTNSYVEDLQRLLRHGSTEENTRPQGVATAELSSSRSTGGVTVTEHPSTSGTEESVGHAGAIPTPLTSEEANSKYKLKNPIVWMDLEMTGLDPNKDHIIEIAVLITDGELNGPHLEGPDLVIHLPDLVLNNMNEWCIKNHGKSGLTQRSKDSTISLQDAEDKVLVFLQQHTQSMEEPGPTEHKAHLAGNSIYVDRAFLQRHMPRVHAHLHWRLIDVSTLLELARRWYPTDFKQAPKKRVLHTAMADIRESLNELKFYRRTIFKQPGIAFKDYLAAPMRTSKPKSKKEQFRHSLQ